MTIDVVETLLCYENSGMWQATILLLNRFATSLFVAH